MDKELRRMLELSGQGAKNGYVASLYEKYGVSGNALRGFEGPFQMPSGATVHYSVTENKFYNAVTKSYLSEAAEDTLSVALVESVDSVVLNATRNNTTVSLRLEGMSSVAPMVSVLRNNGYDDFSTGDSGEEEPMSYTEPESEMPVGNELQNLAHMAGHISMMIQKGEVELSQELTAQIAAASQALGAVHSSMGDDEVGDVDAVVTPAAEPTPDMAPRMEGNDYSSKTDDELDYIKKDASAAAKSMKGTDAEAKYLDQVNDASTEQHKRKKVGESKGRSNDTKHTGGLSDSVNKAEKKSLKAKDRQQGKKAALDETEEKKAENVSSYSKGDKVMYSGKEATVVVADAQGDQVGIDKGDGKTDLVSSSKLSAVAKKDDKKDAPEDNSKKIPPQFQKGGGAKKDDKKDVDEAAVSATLFDNDAMPANAVDDADQKDERTGRMDRTETKNKVPAEVLTALNKRVTELKKSIERYDGKGYNEKSVKGNAIDALEQIKKNLAQGDHEGFMEANIFYNTLMSPITDMFPGQVVNYIMKGSNEQ